ncbi:DUF1173 family protein [Pseudomonas aeruginosa]
MDKRYTVLIQYQDQTQQPYTPDFQTKAEFAKGWKAVMAKAHAGADITCLCFGRGAKKLAVRHLAGADGYCLARYPNTGPQHANDCIYYAPDASKSGLQGYAEGVVTESDDGGLRVRLGLGLRKKDPLESAAATAQVSTGTSTRRPAMTLLGLLHLLWSEARLNTWYPRMEGKRRLGLVHAKLQETAASILASGSRLSDFLLVAATDRDKAQAAANDAKAAEAHRLDRRLVVIAPLAKYTKGAEDGIGRLPIYGFAGIPLLTLSKSLWAGACRSFPAEIAAWKAGGRVIAIAITDTPGAGKANVMRLALMAVSERWIPVASSFEADIEQLLRDEGRSYWKPLRFDASEDEVFPDFWLLDTGERETPMEVFGRSDPSYLQRKNAKIRHYNREFGPSGWWSWDAAADPKGITRPALPERTQR